MDSINYTFFLSLSIIVIGYLFKVTGILSTDHGKSLSKIIINVTLPALILITLSTIELDFSLFLMPLFCLAANFCMAAIAFFVFKKRVNQERGVAMLTTVGFNVGLFAYPLIEGLFGTPALKLVAMFDFGNAFIVFGLSYLLGYQFSTRQKSARLSLKEILLLLLKSVPFMSYMLAIALNLSGFRIPTPLQDILGIVARANMAMALLVLGLTLNFRFDKSNWNLILKVLGVRYGCGLVIGSLLYLWLPFSGMYKIVLLFALNLPVGLATIPYAAELEYDTNIAGTIGNLSIIISFLFMWVFLLVSPP